MNIGLLHYRTASVNKGCDALGYSTIAILLSLYDNSNLNFINFTLPSTYEGNSNLILQYFKNLSLKNEETHFKKAPIDSIKKVLNLDLVLDVTWGDSFSDIYSKETAYGTIKRKLIFEFFRIPLIIMPQTLGPFNNKKLLKMALFAIKHSNRIYTRDILSEKYVHNYLPQKNIMITTDLAFALPYNRTSFSDDKFNIGINVSGLLWRGGFTKNNQFELVTDYQQCILTIFEILVNNSNYRIHIIPHVIDQSGENDGDIIESRFIHEKFPSTILAPKFETPIEAKNYISGMDIFIGARMHATIAAFSSGVPVIPMAYSRKFAGLYNNLGYNYILDLKELDTQTVIDTAIKWIENPEPLRDSAKIALKKAFKQLDDFKADFKQTIDSIMAKKRKNR